MRATEIAKAAADLVGGGRANTHGEMTVNHTCIAEMVNGYLRARKAAGKPEALTAEDMANVMECLKIARRLFGAFNIDDYIDGAGYAACAGEIRSKAESGKSVYEIIAEADRAHAAKEHGATAYDYNNPREPMAVQPLVPLSPDALSQMREKGE